MTDKIESTEKQKDNRNEAADFETAISATGFGKFNCLLLIIAGPGCLAATFETSTMSYILPSAECHLQLSLIDKGVLNAITYAGMITSPIIWGYTADRLGRKKLLVFGFLMDFVCIFCASLSQTKYVLMAFKFFGGALMCGPFAVLMTYVTEFHGTVHRARVMMCMGIYFSSGTLLLPLIAWGLLPNDWSLNIFNLLVINSWQVFIAACTIPSLLAGLMILFLPESPKFLMSQGRNEEALQVFQKLFSMNKGKPKSEYPIKTLVNEVTEKTVQNGKSENVDKVQSPVSGWSQVRPMFHKPYLGQSLLSYLIQFLLLMGLNTYRLWLPQLFTSIADFEENYILTNSTGNSDLCEIIGYSVRKSEQNVAYAALDDYECETKIADNMYVNTIIVGVSGLVGYLITGAVINAVGNKRILIFGMTISGICATLMFLAKTSLATLILSSIIVTIASICSTALLGVVVNMFPTTLRTLIVSISMMFGRLGALIGNVLFPYFMSMGCIPPFIMIGFVMLASAFLCIFLPQTNKTALK